MPLPGRFLTSVLLRREGELLLFDCGEGTQISLKKMNLRWKKISAIFISHTHADHVTGLPGILMLSSQVQRDDPLYIIGPPKIREYVELTRQVLDMYINYEIKIIEIEDPSVPQTVYTKDGFSVMSFGLNHSRVCTGYTMCEDPRPGVFYPDKAVELGLPRGPLWSTLQNGQAVTAENGTVVTPDMVTGPQRAGRKFSFVTDTAYMPGIAGHVGGSDLLICEGMFEGELEQTAAEKKHLTVTQAAHIARDAGGVKKMGMIHFSPRYTNRQLEALCEQAREIFPDTFLARDRMTIPINFEE